MSDGGFGCLALLLCLLVFGWWMVPALVVGLGLCIGGILLGALLNALWKWLWSDV